MIENDKATTEKAWKTPFMILACGQAVSLVGSSAVQFALIWHLAAKTGSPMVMSLAGLAAFLPQFVLGPFAGVWVDRLRRKSVIIAADLFIGAMAALFALSYNFWDPPFWSVALVLFLRAAGTVFHTPAIQAAITMMVPKEELVRANGWNQFIQSGAFLLGPVLGAFLYAVLPMPLVLLTDTAGAIIASLSVLAIAIPEIDGANRSAPDFVGEIREGVHVFLKDRNLSIVTLTITLSMIFFMPLNAFYPLMTSDYFQGNAYQASIVEISYALGMMAGAGVMSGVGALKNKLAVVHLGFLATGVFTGLCGILPRSLTGLWMFTALCLALGASGNVLNIPYMAYIQETIPVETQGRAFSLVGSLMSLCMPLGLLFAGPVAESNGVAYWFAVAGVVIALISIVSAAIVLPKHSVGL